MTKTGQVYYDSPVGTLNIQYMDEAVTYIGRVDFPEEHSTDLSKFEVFILRQLDEYFSGKRTRFDFPYRLDGTAFQLKVWDALTAIPYGETVSYKDIAINVGSPKAYRAVGMANNRNPISIAIPCHRVVGANGDLVGYGGGLDMKVKLLELEKKVSLEFKKRGEQLK